MTGSNGKTTTVLLVHEYFKSIGIKSVVVASCGIDLEISNYDKNREVDIPIFNETSLINVIDGAIKEGAEYLILEINERTIDKGYIEGINMVLGYNSLVSTGIPEDVIPDKIKSILKSDDYQLIIVTSEYTISTDDCNKQLDELNEVVKKYDKNGMVIGEAACTKDLISITDVDFKVVSIVSIAFIFIIILVSFKSLTLPIVLVCIIEFAIVLNLGITYYTKTDMTFIIPVCISTIQLGSSVDYAILLTSNYKKERTSGKNAKEAVKTALINATGPIITSAVGMFSATIGVAIYSDINVISTMCNLLARGAILSMAAVLIVLPGLLILFDKVICKTSLDFKNIECVKE